MIDCIILCGGLGTRLKSLGFNLPKSLIAVNEQPFLSYLMTFLKKENLVDKIILATGFQGAKVKHYCMNDLAYGSSVLFSQEKEPLGTGGALKKALELCTTESVLALNGDCFFDFSLLDFYRHYRETQADFSIACASVEHASRYGCIDFSETTFQIRSFNEKVFKERAWINAGYYLFKRCFFEQFDFPEKFSLEKEAFPQFCSHRFFAFPADGFFIDIGTPFSYKFANETFKEKKFQTLAN